MVRSRGVVSRGRNSTAARGTGEGTIAGAGARAEAGSGSPRPRRVRGYFAATLEVIEAITIDAILNCSSRSAMP